MNAPRDDTPHPADLQSHLPQVYTPPTPVAVAKGGETSSSAIAAREKAAVEARFLVAINRPRVFEASLLRILAACQRPKFAATARYSKPVGAEKVHGLSVRFAEEARIQWGNLEVSAFLVFDDDERRIYRVVGTDLETNATEATDVMVEKFVERRSVKDGQEVVGQRANSKGQIVYRIRATEDDLLVKANAHLSKAKRNVILALIPSDVREEAEQQIIQTIKDRDAKDPAAARRDVFAAFWTLGVPPEQIQALLGKPLEQINPAELTLLRAYYTALKDGEATWSDIVESHGGKAPATTEPAASATGGSAKLRSKLAEPVGQTVAAAAAAPTAPVPDEPSLEQEELAMVANEERRKR